MDITQLNKQFGIDGVVSFIPGQGGLTKMVVKTPAAEGEIYLHGAHVAGYRPAGGRGAIWMSKQSWFEPSKPIRGGVPICWPWFGAHPSRSDLPGHGFARLREWTVKSVQRQGDAVSVELSLSADEKTKAIWPGEFELNFTVTIGPSLIMQLKTTNTGREAFSYAEALHTYLAVSDVRNVQVRGLEGAEYIDTVGGQSRLTRQADAPLTFSAETDSTYAGNESTCTLEDPAWGRRIAIAKSGSRTTQVWNPWIAKAARMPDFGDNEWPEMLCIETCNAKEDSLTLRPGESHTMEAHISAEAM